MTGLTIQNTDERLILTVDKNNFTEEVLLKACNLARLQYLAGKPDFDKTILDMREEIKADWWEKNRAKLFETNE